MAKHLQQLDLFGSAPAEPVHIKRAKVEKPAPAKETVLPSVSRAPMHFGKATTTHKRGRKSFASMEGEMEKLKVPSAEELSKKLYYPIGEVAVWFNANTSLIRYWEKEFKQLQPRKTRKGDRLFRAQDVEFLKQIYYLLREKKYSIDGAKTYLKNNKEKAEKDLALINSLKNIRGFLVSLKASL
jgi:DNA-binding transcriptional MerR regulator